MDSKQEVKNMLKESGNESLFTEENYRIATALTKEVEKRDKKMKEFFSMLEGTREKYKHDLIVKNCSPVNNTTVEYGKIYDHPTNH